jgi:hypothetical protein
MIGKASMTGVDNWRQPGLLPQAVGLNGLGLELGPGLPSGVEGEDVVDLFTLPILDPD